jgi:alpha-amylase/alpha-mannosidase (GH57 family)
MIEQQDGAHPYHDWNERIAAECYGPNAWSRILDDQGRIAEIVNNYSRISFNYGPTLLSWLEEHAGDTYQRILQADKDSQQRFGGHGSALAQSYNHIIMPLADERTRRLQVSWGIRDFEHRFKRMPEGMWLSECAADTPTLEEMAAQGIKFTILAPRQAKSVRQIGGRVWSEVGGNKINPRRPYRCNLPSGRHIDIFFYDGIVSQAVAFEKLLDNGAKLKHRLVGAFDHEDKDAQLVHIATDGESYGHHHRFGDMALAFAINHIEQNPEIELTNYGQFLEINPPTEEVEIFENSSWSCVHGVERWRDACGCGGSDQINLEWRKPLRDALDYLAEVVDKAYDEIAPSVFHKPEEARHEYIELVLDRSVDRVNQFLEEHTLLGADALKDLELQAKALRLLEMTRQRMLMFTSCAWFFEDVARVEPVQILRYANRAIQFVQRLSETDPEPIFEEKLGEAPVNDVRFENGAQVYRELAAAGRLDLSKVGMHYAVYSLFEEFPERMVICNYEARSTFYERFEAGGQKFALGKTRVQSLVTRSREEFCFAVVYLGQHQIIGQFETDLHPDAFDEFYEEAREAFSESRVTDLLGLMQQFFSGPSFSFWNLFREEQRKVIDRIMGPDRNHAESAYKEIFDRNYNIMNVLRSAELPIPEVFARNLEVVINTELRKAFENGQLNPRKMEKLTMQSRRWDVKLDRELIAYAAGKRLLKAIRQFDLQKEPALQVQRINRVFQVIRDLNLEPDLWEIQNAFYRLDRSLRGKIEGELLEEMAVLGEHLGVSTFVMSEKAE